MSEYRCHPGCMQHEELPTSHHPDCAVQATRTLAAENREMKARLARVAYIHFNAEAHGPLLAGIAKQLKEALDGYVSPCGCIEAHEPGCPAGPM